MLVPFHCTECSKLPPNHSSIPKISRFFTVGGGVFGLFLILSLVLPSLPPAAMITMVCLGSLFIATAIVSEIINYLVKEKRQKQEEATLQSQLKLVQQAIDKFYKTEPGCESFLHFDYPTDSAQIIMKDLYSLSITNDSVRQTALLLRLKYPQSKVTFSKPELMDLMVNYLSLKQDLFASLRDENPKKYCALASLFPILEEIFTSKYGIHKYYEHHKMSWDASWHILATISQNAFFAFCIAEKQNHQNHEEIPFSLIFYYLKEQEKQMKKIDWKIN